MDSRKLAVVFGGARDIGAATCIELGKSGFDIALTYHASAPVSVLSTLEQISAKSQAYQVDALDPSSIRTVLSRISAEWGRPVDLLVNVVGGLVARKRMTEMDDNFWDMVYALNVRSVFVATQAVLPHLRDGGAIVNVSSQAGRDGGGAGAIAYGSSKAALMGMTRALAKELGPRKIRVNAVCPGMIATKFHDDFTTPEVRARVASMTPLGREGRAEEVGALIAYLGSEQASFVNGTCVDINGGTLFS
jgi:3-oxoacyl-[acyl-carrier protein] reductase